MHNIVGRFLNGVPEKRVCDPSERLLQSQHAANTMKELNQRSVAAEQVTGDFVHIEQSARARAQEANAAWVRALKAMFRVIN